MAVIKITKTVIKINTYFGEFLLGLNELTHAECPVECLAGTVSRGAKGCTTAKRPQNCNLSCRSVSISGLIES